MSLAPRPAASSDAAGLLHALAKPAETCDLRVPGHAALSVPRSAASAPSDARRDTDIILNAARFNPRRYPLRPPLLRLDRWGDAWGSWGVPTDPLNQPTTDREARRVRALRRRLIALLALALLAHAMQIASPLRLNTDSVLLLRMAEAFDEGRGFKPADVPAPFPIGYPTFIAGLRAIGLDQAAGLIGANVLALCVALAATWALIARLARHAPPPFDASLAPPLVCLLSATSWIIVKHTPIVVSELLFLALSMLTLLVISSGGWARRFLLGGALIGACVLLRTIGLALVPALLWSGLMMWLDHRRAAGRPLNVRSAWWLAPVGVGAIALAALLAARSRYWSDMLSLYGTQSLTDAVLRTARFRLSDMGQFTLNLSSSAVDHLPALLFTLAGVAGYAVIFAGLFRLRRAPHPALVYLAASTAFVLIWPYEDPRFLLPVIPVMLWAMLHAPGLPRARPARWALVTAWVSLGAAAMAYSTMLTFSGSAFPDRFGAGEFRDSYRAAFGQPHDPANINPHVLRMLQRHDRAHTKQPAPSRNESADQQPQHQPSR